MNLFEIFLFAFFCKLSIAITENHFSIAAKKKPWSVPLLSYFFFSNRSPLKGILEYRHSSARMRPPLSHITLCKFINSLKELNKKRWLNLPEQCWIVFFFFLKNDMIPKIAVRSMFGFKQFQNVNQFPKKVVYFCLLLAMP